MSAPQLSFPAYTASRMAARTKKKPESSKSPVPVTALDTLPIQPKPVHARDEKIPTVRIQKQDQKHRDVLVSSQGVRYNYSKVTRTWLGDDRFEDTISRAVGDGNEPLPQVFAKMTNEEKSDFCSKKEFGIIVDLARIPRSKAEAEARNAVNAEYAAICESVNVFAPEICYFSTKLVIAIEFPPIIEASISFGKQDMIKIKASPAYQLVDRIAQQTSSFKSLELLHIVLFTKDNQADKFLLEFRDLALVLPFYKASFKGWEVFWQKPHMRTCTSIHGHHLAFLDREFKRVQDIESYAERKALHAEKRRADLEEKQRTDRTYGRKLTRITGIF